MRRPVNVCIFCLSRSTLPPVRPRAANLLYQRPLHSSSAASRPASAAARAQEQPPAEPSENHSSGQKTFHVNNQLPRESSQNTSQKRKFGFGQRTFNFDNELSEEERAIRDSLKGQSARNPSQNAPVSQRQESQGRHPQGRPSISQTRGSNDGRHSPPSIAEQGPRIRLHMSDSPSDSATWRPQTNDGPGSTKQYTPPARQPVNEREIASNWSHVRMREPARSGFRLWAPPAASEEIADDKDDISLLEKQKSFKSVRFVTLDNQQRAQESGGIQDGTGSEARGSSGPIQRIEAEERSQPYIRAQESRGMQDRSESGARGSSGFIRRIVTEETSQPHTRPDADLSGSGRSLQGGRRMENPSEDRLKPKWSDRSGRRHEGSSELRNGRRDTKEQSKKPQRRSARADEDEADEAAARREVHRQKKEERRTKRTEEAPAKPVLIPEFISVLNLSSLLRVRVEAFSSKLQDLGFSDTNNDHILDAETAGLIAAEFNYEPILPVASTAEDLVAEAPPDDDTFLLSRPPVITIMGHVDHGKTTLLDWLRKSSVAASEHGGITQHIGAFTVEMPSGRTITFLDTPGHAAFLDMRARGAHVTDIVILVVAADDSVKPQTLEAIKHAKAARVPLIVAINKMDKDGADPDAVKRDLARHGITVEDYGGDTQTVEVSGKTGLGMEELEDAAIALADILDVRADTTGATEGWVLEAAAKASGKVATVLVRRGTLRSGQVLVAGTTWTRVRTLHNEAGKVIHEVGPGAPVEVDGWRELPAAGAEVLQAGDEQRARRVIDLRRGREESARLARDVVAVNESRKAEELKRDAEENEKAEALVGKGPPKLVEVPLIIRADVSGSAEALGASLLSLGNSEVRPLLLRSQVGSPSPGDLDLATTVKGHIVAFGVPIDGALLTSAERAGVRVIDGSIIYRIVDEVKGMLEEKLPPLRNTRVTGEADVAAQFEINLSGRRKLKVAGCRVRNGSVQIRTKVKVFRNGKELYDGTLVTLKNQKKDATEMRKGSECGMSFDGFEEFLPGDTVQCYEVFETKRTL